MNDQLTEDDSAWDGLRVSLVVPIRNEEASLHDLIRSVQAQTRPPDEVILVDGGSTDQTVRLARELTAKDPRFRILQVGAATPGRGRNIGTAAATHSWVAFTDAGIILESTWLEQLLDVVEKNPQVEVVFGNYEPMAGSFFERCAAVAYVPAKMNTPLGRLRAPFVASSLMLRRVWQAVRGFPDLRAAEDLIFIERVRAAGFKIAWAPAATVWWQLQPTLLRTFRRFALYSKHNIWAGQQRLWHHGMAKKYFAVLPFLLLGIFHSAWWLTLPLAGALARIAKSIWDKREGHGIRWLLNPLQFAEVGLILTVVDLATFLGWAQAAWQTRPVPLPSHAPAQAGKPTEVSTR